LGENVRMGEQHNDQDATSDAGEFQPGVSCSGWISKSPQDESDKEESLPREKDEHGNDVLIEANIVDETVLATAKPDSW